MRNATEPEGVGSPVRHILTINSGSSSLKGALYRAEAETLQLQQSMLAERIGLPGAQFRVSDRSGRPVLTGPHDLADHAAALTAIFRTVQDSELSAIGHRVVHGGSAYSQPERVDSAFLQALRELIPIDPMHLPQAIATMEAAGRFRPDIPQVACFDTAFHRTMPLVAQTYPLPRSLMEGGIIRYGFHGLSYEYIVEQLRSLYGEEAGGRVIVAHLGNGASMAAIRDGHGIDTSMGFTPTGGLVMGTRSGDLDPGVLLHLATAKGMNPEELSDLVNRRSGLLGVSGSSSDMRELLDQQDTNPHGAEAVALFCYQARKFLGALAAVLGGLDTLVFTAGIGEHAPAIRKGICEGLEFLGIRLDSVLNQADSPVISAHDSPLTVHIIPTDEDLMIARHTHKLLWGEGANDVSL